MVGSHRRLRPPVPENLLKFGAALVRLLRATVETSLRAKIGY